MTEPDFLSRTRTSYDDLADYYVDWIAGELAAKPLDRAVLGAFAELVLAGGGRPVADIGCGPGRITAHLRDLGLSAFGIDLSPRMITIARRKYPALRFDVGSMTALDIADGELGGIVAWYSIIHVPEAELPTVFAEFHRVLAPGGHAQLGFQLGDDVVHRTDAAGHAVSLDFHRRQLDHVAALAHAAGLVERARMRREPDHDGDFPERTAQGYLLVRKPA